MTSAVHPLSLASWPCLTTWICCVIQCHIEYFLGEALPQSLAQELTTADGINRLRNKISRHLAAHWST